METETQTFTNPSIWSYFNEIAVGASGPDGGRSHAFSRDGWDMEVTFTRKPPPFEPGYYTRTDRRFAHPAALWFEMMPSSSLDVFRETWKRVTVADVEN